ncbi:MAG: ATP-binding protein [Actinomycetota bacterium]|nr:ATP-binding protein [Actinomycetota bacterium]
MPLRVRMTVWFVGLLAVIVAGLGAFVVVRLRADLTHAIDDGLRPAAAQIRADVRVDGVREFPDSARTVLKGERAAAQLVMPDGRIRAAFGDAVARRPMATRAEIADALAGRADTRSRTMGPSRDDFRLTALGVEHRGQRFVIVAAQSLEPVDRSAGRLVKLLLLAGPAALLATALGGWWLARRSLLPIERITGAAAAIGAHRLEERVPVGRSDDEVARLARTLNTMLDRVQHGAEQQRRLVADTSHELRTPLATMRAELDVSLHVDDLSTAAREVLLSTRDEVDRLSRTVDDLLTLAAVDDGVLVLHVEDAELSALAATVAGTLSAVATRRQVVVEHDGPPVAVRADPLRLGHAIRNVVENAIEFSPPGGTVRITTSVSGTAGFLTVEDDGPGVPAALREHVFQRFFRVDPSRSRATGGSGLGLAITREFVQAHGGRVYARAGEVGSAFVIEVTSSDATSGAVRRS